MTTLRDVTAERRLQRDLAFNASHDPLTGLANPTLPKTAIVTRQASPAPRAGEGERHVVDHGHAHDAKGCRR